MKSYVVNKFYDIRAVSRKLFGLEKNSICSRCNNRNSIGRKKSENKCLKCGYSWR